MILSSQTIARFAQSHDKIGNAFHHRANVTDQSHELLECGGSARVPHQSILDSPHDCPVDAALRIYGQGPVRSRW